MPSARTHTDTAALPIDIPVWDPALSVGNAKLDEQHITLLELGRNLVRMVNARPEADEDIQLALQEVAELARRHCELEEGILVGNACPSWSGHKAEHEASLDRLDALLQDAARHRLDRKALAHVVSSWMVHHVLETDQPVKAFMKELAA
jgi:hemerythrin-like metal-binding protein